MSTIRLTSKKEITLLTQINMKRENLNKAIELGDAIDFVIDYSKTLMDI